MEHHPVFDVEQLLRSSCDDPELAAKITDVFLADIPSLLDNLEKAVSDHDANTAMRLAHSIKGACAAVGGSVMRTQALECETLCRIGVLDKMVEAVTRLRAHYQDLRGELLASEFSPSR